MTKREKKRAMARAAKAATVSSNSISFRIEDPEQFYGSGLLQGLKDDGPKSRKLTNGQITVNVVGWGQNKFWDEFYITDKIYDNKPLCIISKSDETFIEYFDLNHELGPMVVLDSLPSAPPEVGGWEWVV